MAFQNYLTYGSTLAMLVATWLCYRQVLKIKENRLVEENWGVTTTVDKKIRKKIKVWFFISLFISSFIFIPLVFLYKGNIIETLKYLMAVPVIGFLLPVFKIFDIKALEFLKKSGTKVILASLLGLVVWGLILLAVIDPQSLKELKEAKEAASKPKNT